MKKQKISVAPATSNKVDTKKTKLSRSTRINSQKEKEAEIFYFKKENYRWMLYGLGLILLGFILMLGYDANTIDGIYNPNSWNEDIFSFRRIRLAPWCILLGFGIEVYAILKRF